MKILCDRLLLSDVIMGVSKAVTQRSNLPILEGILFKADRGELVLTGYDLEMGITTTMPANVKEAGEVVISARLLGDMVRRLNSDTVEIETDENLATTIRGGITEFNILGMPPMDYPELPTPGTDPVVTMEAEVLKKMIDSTIYAVSQDDKKPAHTGELLHIEPEKLTIVALDGYRLAICEKPITASRDISIIAPQKTMLELSRLIGDSADQVEISANRRYVVFKAGGYVIMSRLIEGEFLDYQKVVPEGYKTKVTLKTKDFINSIERASLIITERLKNPLRIRFGSTVTVRCQTALGKVSDEFGAEAEGEELEIGFNNRYLLDALKYAGCEEVRFELSGPLSPAKVLPAEGNDFLYLVLPVRFKND